MWKGNRRKITGAVGLGTEPDTFYTYIGSYKLGSVPYSFHPILFYFFSPILFREYAWKFLSLLAEQDSIDYAAGVNPPLIKYGARSSLIFSRCKAVVVDNNPKFRVTGNSGLLAFLGKGAYACPE